jgi:hypothetical protein
MKRKFLAVAAAAFALGSASASAATFTLNLSGTGFETVSTECGPGLPDCMPAVAWFGTLTVETTSAADGTYSGLDVPLVALDTNLYTFSLDTAADTSCCDLISVTLAHGTPVAFGIAYNPTPFENFTVDGLHATFLVETNGRGGVFPSSGGDATVFEVPEPASPVMLLAGLAVAAVGLRFRGGSASAGRSPGPGSA